MRKFFALTPFFIISIGFLLYALYAFGAEFFYSESEGWGILLFGIYIVCCIGVLIADMVIKLIIRSKKNVLIIQFVVLAFIGLYYLLSDVKQSVKLPVNFDKNYVTMVFDIEDEQKLPPRFLPFQNPIQVNEDGYILTSSSLPSFAYGNQKYELKNEDNQIIGSKESNLDFITFPAYDITHQNKTYRYLTFKIQPKKECCGWSSQEINEHHQEVEDYLKKHLN